MGSLQNSLATLLNDPVILFIWIGFNLASVGIVVRDLNRRNPQTHGLMRLVWILTALYSGPIGLAVYYYSGRRQIARDSIWRRSFRSVAHCYSGCGAGEIIGLVVTLGVMGLGTFWVSISTFLLAYVLGFALTIGPLMVEGESFATAIMDSFVAETTSITAMEVTAIGVGLWIAGDATLGEPLYWTSLLVSLSVGFFAAYPVNLVLIRLGIKSGMGHPGGDHRHGH